MQEQHLKEVLCIQHDEAANSSEFSSQCHSYWKIHRGSQVTCTQNCFMIVCLEAFSHCRTEWKWQLDRAAPQVQVSLCSSKQLMIEINSIILTLQGQTEKCLFLTRSCRASLPDRRAISRGKNKSALLWFNTAGPRRPEVARYPSWLTPEQIELRVQTVSGGGGRGSCINRWLETNERLDRRRGPSSDGRLFSMSLLAVLRSGHSLQLKGAGLQKLDFTCLELELERRTES